jgi:hypothetical protein
MATIAAPRASGSGRQSAAIEQERDLELEAIAHGVEDLAFAERVRQGADRIVAAAAAGDRRFIVNEAGKLGYHATRRLRQLEGSPA